MSWKLGEKPKAKKSKELKKIHILDCGFCCLSSRENMFMGKGPAWSQIFFNSDFSSWCGFKPMFLLQLFTNRNILHGLYNSRLQLKQPLVLCFLAISIQFSSYQPYINSDWAIEEAFTMLVLSFTDSKCLITFPEDSSWTNPKRKNSQLYHLPLYLHTTKENNITP